MVESLRLCFCHRVLVRLAQALSRATHLRWAVHRYVFSILATMESGLSVMNSRVQNIRETWIWTTEGYDLGSQLSYKHVKLAGVFLLTNEIARAARLPKNIRERLQGPANASEEFYSRANSNHGICGGYLEFLGHLLFINAFKPLSWKLSAKSPIICLFQMITVNNELFPAVRRV
jgi:hypothetical protein